MSLTLKAAFVFVLATVFSQSVQANNCSINPLVLPIRVSRPSLLYFQHWSLTSTRTWPFRMALEPTEASNLSLVVRSKGCVCLQSWTIHAWGTYWTVRPIPMSASSAAREHLEVSTVRQTALSSKFSIFRTGMLRMNSNSNSLRRKTVCLLIPQGHRRTTNGWSDNSSSRIR